MAIQFFCVACSQPIEVDDEMANQAVTCPYCRKVVSAPAVSDSTIQQQPASARATGPQQPMEGPYGSQPPAIPPRTNVLSWVSLACLSFALVSLAIFAGFLISIMRGQDTSQMEQAELNKLLQTELMSRPGLQMLSMVGFCGAPVVGVICAVIALIKRTPPRWPAVVSLSILSLFLLCLIGSVIVQAAQMAGQVAP